ncbi:ComEA family DNA-binding protein [Gilvimarinus chinensis]|uniref:ComEA family DNA-binding protein n=1 Tax=Gilvimarinus chinensis TaxID=396005 RepID=UPI000361C392|nr:ComEA family DNA-binding protein [Gilvimarinus chinensis]
MKHFFRTLFLILTICSFTPLSALADEAQNPPAQVININTADVQDLTQLKGIGETKAKAIVAWREQHGNFESPEQLLAVNGIGEATLEDIKSQIKLQ